MPKMDRSDRRAHRFAGMSKEGRRGARRQVFLEAGIDVIADVGLANTKVRAICDRAGLTERYFYESFATLQQFALQVVHTVAAQLSMTLLGEALQVSDGHARLRAVTKKLVSAIDADRRVGRILFVEAARAGGELARLRHQMLYNAAWLMSRWLIDQQSTSDLAALAAPLWAQLLGVVPMESEVDDINTIAIAGACAEILDAWLDERIELSAEDLGEYLLRYIDQTVAWQQG